MTSDEAEDVTRQRAEERNGAGESGRADGKDAGERAVGPEEPSVPGFEDLGLVPRLVEAVRRAGYDRPTPIQRMAIPAALAGRDIMGMAHTGTGKTAAFSLPMLQRLEGASAADGSPGGLVVTPTRELARQVEVAIATYGATSSVEPLVVHGGTPLGPEAADLRWGCDVLVATPGRLLDHLRRGNVDLAHVQVLVLDEADRMLDMGFIDDVREIVAATPRSRQTLLFSATLPNAILSLAHEMMRDPERVQVGAESAAAGIRQVVHPVDWADKHQLLTHLLRDLADGQVLVFTRTRNTAGYLADVLRARGFSADDLHGGKSQDERTRSLNRFREGEVRILVATNVAARGLDIRGIRHVVNFDVPEDPRDYVHRVGRTARADDTGDAITLMSPNEWLLVRDVELLMGEPIPRAEVEGFEPTLEPPKPAGAEPEAEERRERSALTRGVRRR